MTVCQDERPEEHAGKPVDDGWGIDIDIDEGDGGDYDRALDAYDRSKNDG